MMRRSILAVGMLVAWAAGITAAETGTGDARLVKPRSVRALVADGKHNAFTALVHWKDVCWLAFRKGKSHNSNDGDMVLLDINLPDMSGIELAQYVSSNHPGVGIVALSAPEGHDAVLPARHL